MKLCHTCNNSEILFSISCNPEEAQWIKHENLDPVPVNLNPKECKVQHPKNSDIEIKLSQKVIKPGKKILYWAANGKKLQKAHEVTNALPAYDRKKNGKEKKVKNFGCTKVKKDGTIEIKIESPQCYIEKKKLWAKHIHFVEEGEENTWKKDNFYTVLGLPVESENMKTKCLKKGNVYVTPEQVRKNWKKGEFYMVYALSKKHPSLVNLEKYKDLKHLHIDHESENFTLPRNIKKTTPLVLYCVKKSCNAAKNLMLKLVEKGYENLFYMEEGMTEFSMESLELISEHSRRSTTRKLKSMAL